MKINYDQISLDYESRDITIEDNYLKIVSLDGSVTKIDINYLSEKYIIEDEENESLL